MKKSSLTIAAFAMLSVPLGAWADSGTLGDTQTVCQSTRYEYEVDPSTPTSTYEWDFSGMGTSGTDYSLTDSEANHYKVQIGWLTPTSGLGRVMKYREISSSNCVGQWKTTTVTVNPKPVVDPTTSTLCSSGQGGTGDLDKYNIDLTTTDKNSRTVTKWDLAYAAGNPPSGVTMSGATIPATGVTSAAALKNMVFTNSNTTEQTVTINVTPYIGDCPGDPYTITITVLPPVGEPTVTYRSL